MKSVDVQCPKCGGYGICRNHGGPKDLGMVCHECDGSGKKTLWYKPFTRRKTRKGIAHVTRPDGRLGAIGFGALAGPRIPYTEFQNGKMPPDAFTPIP